MLTKRQKQILDFLKGYKKKNRIAPSLDEIRDHLGLSSVSTIHHHLKALEEAGFIAREENQPRAIEIFETEQMVQIPLAGTISAGQPIEAVEEKESISVPKSKLPKSGNFYALRVSGDSMIEEKINDGDLVVIKEQTTAENGQKVVALIDNYDATLKTFYKEKGRIRLQPANKNLEPIILDKKKRLDIQGVVVDIIKQANNTLPKERKQETIKPERNLKKFINKVIEGDCLEVMKKFPDKSVDMILCDLPYGTTQNNWDSLIPLSELWSDYERIIKDNGVIALTSQGPFTANLINSNQRLFKYKITWIKSKATNFLNAKKQPLRKHEDICIFYKKQPAYNPQRYKGEPYNKGVRKNQLTGSYGDFDPVEVKSEGGRYPTDVVYFKTAESEGKVFHPTQKPVGLGRYLIRTYTKPGDVVLDNACGSGSFLVSAVLEGRKFIGIEKNEDVELHKKYEVDYIKICKDRIKEAKQKVNYLF